jgi:hypothetical protein
MHKWIERRRFKRALQAARGSVLTIQKTVRMFLAKRSMQAVKDAFALVRSPLPLALVHQTRDHSPMPDVPLRAPGGTPTYYQRPRCKSGALSHSR